MRVGVVVREEERGDRDESGGKGGVRVEVKVEARVE